MTTAMRLLGRVLYVGVVAVVVALVALLVVVPRVTGTVPLTVLTGSMTPTIPVGSVVMVKPVDPTTLRPGDVITFQTTPGLREFVTHRVVATGTGDGARTFITKGDANAGNDIAPVPFGAVRGEVQLHVPYVGHASQLVQGPRGWGLLVSAGGVLLLVHIAGRLMRRRHTALDSTPHPA